MKWSARIDKAIETVARLHGGTMRRNGVTPYLVHPFTVAWMVSEYTDNEDTIIAALFHDLIEDVTGYNLDDIVHDFGNEVAQMVGLMSNNIAIGNNNGWLDKKTKHFNKYCQADNEVLLILLMNHLHNVVTMQEELKQRGNEFWKLFHGTKAEKYQWEEMNWQLFNKKNLPQKPVQKLRELIDDVYQEVIKTG